MALNEQDQLDIEAGKRSLTMIEAQVLVIERLDKGDKVLELDYYFDNHTADKAIAALAYSICFHYATNNIGKSSYTMFGKALRRLS